MNLILDRGNTFLKVALFKQGKLYKVERWDNYSERDLHHFVEDHAVEAAIWSSVREEMPAFLNEMPFPCLNFNTGVAIPITLNYQTPDTLGLDRRALAVAAYQQYPAQDCLVIDAGTALTYDLLDRSGVYHGGAIAPGMKMRFRALHQFTARLPYIEYNKEEVDLVGKSTEDSIRSGVVNGMRYEILATIEAYRERYPQLITIMTGGDALAFDSLLKNSIFAAPEFLLQGLNYILEHHANDK